MSSAAAAASLIESNVLPDHMLDPFDEEILNGDREANLALKACFPNTALRLVAISSLLSHSLSSLF